MTDILTCWTGADGLTHFTAARPPYKLWVTAGIQEQAATVPDWFYDKSNPTVRGSYFKGTLIHHSFNPILSSPHVSSSADEKRFPA